MWCEKYNLVLHRTWNVEYDIWRVSLEQKQLWYKFFREDREYINDCTHRGHLGISTTDEKLKQWKKNLNSSYELTEIWFRDHTLC